MPRLTISLTIVGAPLLAAYSPGVAHSPSRTAVRTTSPVCGLFDGVKDAFGGDKPLVAADRVTPFDRWMGLDKALVEAENTVDESAVYIDPNNAENYFSVEL